MELDPDLAELRDSDMFAIGRDTYGALLIVGRVALHRIFSALELRIPVTLVSEETVESRVQVQLRIA